MAGMTAAEMAAMNDRDRRRPRLRQARERRAAQPRLHPGGVQGRPRPARAPDGARARRPRCGTRRSPTPRPPACTAPARSRPASARTTSTTPTGWRRRRRAMTDDAIRQAARVDLRRHPPGLPRRRTLLRIGGEEPGGLRGAERHVARAPRRLHQAVGHGHRRTARRRPRRDEGGVRRRRRQPAEADAVPAARVGRARLREPRGRVRAPQLRGHLRRRHLQDDQGRHQDRQPNDDDLRRRDRVTHPRSAPVRIGIAPPAVRPGRRPRRDRARGASRRGARVRRRLGERSRRASRRAVVSVAVPLRPAADARLRGRGHAAGRARHERARRAATQPAVAGERAREPRRAERGPAHDRGRRRLVGGRVRRARPAVPQPRPADRRDPRAAAHVLARRPASFHGDVLRVRRPPRAAEARARDPDLGRRRRGGGVPAGGRARRRLPAHRRHARGDRAPIATPAGRATRAGVRISLRTGWDPAGHGARPHPARVRRVRGGRRPARDLRAVAHRPRRMAAVDGDASRPCRPGDLRPRSGP